MQTQQTELQKKVVAELELPHSDIDFAAFYKRVMLMYLRGVIKMNKGKP